MPISGLVVVEMHALTLTPPTMLSPTRHEQRRYAAGGGVHRPQRFHPLEEMAPDHHLI